MATLTQAAIDTYDMLDGVVDGIISSPELYHFDPYTMVNQMVQCSDSKVLLSSIATRVANAA